MVFRCIILESLPAVSFAFADSSYCVPPHLTRICSALPGFCACASSLERRGLARMSATRSPADLRLEEARKILTSFPAKDYIAPLWARNQHVNTIAGALFVTPPKPDYVRQVYFVFLPISLTRERARAKERARARARQTDRDGESENKSDRARARE